MRLEELEENSTYVVKIFIVSGDSSKISSFSELLTFTTAARGVSFGRLMADRCEKIENREGMDIFAVPLSKTYSDATVERYAFGKPSNSSENSNKTLLLMGAIGCGKTSLINGIFNWNFSVDWNDPFRFQLPQIPQSCVKVCDIPHYEGFRLKRSLTIINTPGYQEDSNKNQEITEKIRDFFVNKNYGIQEVDAVGLVINSSLPSPSATEKFIYESIVSIFGHKVKDNIKYLFTFADQHDPPLLKNFSGSDLIPLPKLDNFGEIDHFKFDSSAFFCLNPLLSPADRQVIFQ